jgi:serine/threonine protein kinase
MQFETCGPYVLLEKVASGGMAEVYLAKAPGAEGVSKFLAVKRILPQYSSNEDFIEMFKSEAKIAININHTNIVSIYEFGLSRQQFYLSMEYVHGKNLRQLINKIKKQNQAMPIEHIVYIVNEVAKGLDYAHRFIDRSTGKPLNIIHRDMSPQNVMVSYEGEVKIVDFGIAKAESKLEATQAGTLKGKFGYMSPEQAEGLELDYRTDIFSLGIILWELLANDRLFLANNEVNTIRKIRDCNIPPITKINPQVHADLEAITNKALARDRSLRYQSASDLHRDLNKFLNKYYHEYTSQDFSQFIKKMYLQEMMEMRDKLVEFAKITVVRDNNEQNETTRTITNTASDIGGAQNAVVPISDSKLTKNLDFKNAIALDERSVSKNLRRTNSGFSNTNSNYGYANQNTNYTVTVDQPAKSNAITLFLSLAILVTAGYLYYDQQALMELKVAIGLIPQESKVISSVAPTPVSTVSPQDFTFHVKSSPPGARIYIDETDSGFFTPGRVRVKPNTTFTLSLRKDGYLDYRKQIVPTANGQQFQGTLQKSKIGYISIYVPVPNVDIYINGNKILEKPPITRYAVPAASRVSVKAINPMSKAYDETTISVREDSHQQVNLFPKKK